MHHFNITICITTSTCIHSKSSNSENITMSEVQNRCVEDEEESKDGEGEVCERGRQIESGDESGTAVTCVWGWRGGWG